MNLGEELKLEFPSAGQIARGYPLVYLDSAATSLKPSSMVRYLSEVYLMESANVHRGAHYLSDRATEKYELSRSAVSKFINANQKEEIVFTKGTTEAINLVADSLGKTLNHGDEVILSILEHHSNIVPWHKLKNEKGIKLKFIDLDSEGNLDFKHFESLVNERTKILSLTHCSNALGTHIPIKKFISFSKKKNIKTIVDAAQSINSTKVDVKDLDCDFLCFSAHKLFGPFGLGVLYGNYEMLNQLDVYQVGGSMIEKVEQSDSTYLKSPHRFEAGTGAIAEVIAFTKSLDLVNQYGYEKIALHEKKLMQLAFNELKEVSNLKIHSNHNNSTNILSFNLNSAHCSDVGSILDQQGVAVRTGHHCCQPLMDKLGISGTVRASFSIYNDEQDVEALIKAVKKAVELLS